LVVYLVLLKAEMTADVMVDAKAVKMGDERG
jgi:hypothetical protein